MKDNKWSNSIAHRARRGGFTLVELLVVIALAAIFITIAVPSYRSLLVQDRMAGEINDLSGDIEFARAAAVESGLPVTICGSNAPSASAPVCAGGDWSGGWVVFRDVDDNQTFSAAAGDTVLRFHRALDGGDTLAGKLGTPGALGGALTGITVNRMGTMVNAVLTVHDADDTTAWRHCLIVPMTGTVTADSEQQNPGVCP